MRYSLFAGGAKRLRPILCLAAAEACRGDVSEALPLACAVECVHTYSLIHDDLPSMDNDDFRRGQPTCHKVFGDGMAILAGDALLTFAFELAARANAWPLYDTRALVKELAVTSGSLKLIAGQVADLEAERQQVDVEQLRYIHECKTAALLTTSIRFGGMSANAAPEQLAALTRFGHTLGLAFQVIDDILDVTQTSDKLGKSAGQRPRRAKSHLPLDPRVGRGTGGGKAVDRRSARCLGWFRRRRQRPARLGRPLVAARLLSGGWQLLVVPERVDLAADLAERINPLAEPGLGRIADQVIETLLPHDDHEVGPAAGRFRRTMTGLPRRRLESIRW